MKLNEKQVTRALGELIIAVYKKFGDFYVSHFSETRKLKNAYRKFSKDSGIDDMADEYLRKTGADPDDMVIDVPLDLEEELMEVESGIFDLLYIFSDEGILHSVLDAPDFKRLLKRPVRELIDIWEDAV